MSRHRSLPAAVIAIIVLTVGLVLAAGSGATAAPSAHPRPTCRHHHCPSPSPTPTSPSPTPTSPSPSPSNTGGFSCHASGWENGNGICGPYAYSKITNSNGSDTYVENNCWGHPGCTYQLASNNPGDWQVTATEAAGNTAVMSYPNVQQLTNNWDGSGFNGFADVPLAGLSGLTSSYAETMPQASAGTIAQVAWDIWISNAGTHSNEIMVWMDNQGRGTGGAAFYGTYTVAGATWSLYHYGGVNGETIWMPGAQNVFAHTTSATVNLRALLAQLVTLGLENANLTLGQIDFGWEICSTGGGPQTFRMTDYALTLTPA